MSHYSGQEVAAISTTFLCIAGCIVGLRLFTRFYIIGIAGREDYIVILALVFSTAFTVCVFEQVKHGMGQHIWTLSEEEMLNSQKPFWASILFYNLGLTWTKISILQQYLRIFTVSRFRIACWITLGIVAAYGIWTVLGSIFSCIPVARFWDKNIPGTCINQNVAWFTNAALNIVTDFAIAILPMPVLKSLNLPTNAKRALIGVFAVGGIVCIVSILRLQSLVAISNSTDPTWDNTGAATWSTVEINVGIICASLATLRPLASRFFPRIFRSPTPHDYTSGHIRSRRTGRSSNFQQLSLGLMTPKNPQVTTMAKDSDSGLSSPAYEQRVGITTLANGGAADSVGYLDKTGHASRVFESGKDDNEIKVVTVIQQSIERNTGKHSLSWDRHVAAFSPQRQRSRGDLNNSADDHGSVDGRSLEESEKGLVFEL